MHGIATSDIPTTPPARRPDMGVTPASAGSAPPRLARRHRWMLSLDDFEEAARRHLPGPIFSYLSGGAETDQSLRANRASFQDLAFIPRVLVDISRRTTDTTLFDQTFSAPFGIAPMGLQALPAYRGDLVLARAAARAGIPFVMSGSSLIRMEEAIAVNPDAWFQAYLPADEAGNRSMVERAQAAGFRTLVVTLDTAVGANRENNVRAGFSIPLRPSASLAWQGLSHPRWLFGTFLRTLVKHGMPHFENNYAHRGAPILSPDVESDFSNRGRLSWEQLDQVRALWRGRLVLKGVLDARDAREAVLNHGVDGIVVSNHGGRQLDGAIAPLRALPRIVAACPGVPVMLDSGVRRGSDVLKALALGASFVFVGRPFSFGATVAGEAGVLHAISILRQEVSRNLALLGINSPAEIGPDFIEPCFARSHQQGDNS
jgi:L-lactate dehydrogenase (cytochrome)